MKIVKNKKYDIEIVDLHVDDAFFHHRIDIIGKHSSNYILQSSWMNGYINQEGWLGGTVSLEGTNSPKEPNRYTFWAIKVRYIRTNRRESE